MSRRYFIRIAFFIAALLLAIKLVNLFRGGIEPVYQNRTLTEWLKSSLSLPDEYGYRWDGREAKQLERYMTSDAPIKSSAVAVREIGADAVPFLLQWCEAVDTPLRMRIVNWLNAQRLLHLRLHKFKVEKSNDRHKMAHFGFLLLGDRAKSAWPALTRLTYASNPYRRYEGFYCLLCCQPDPKTLHPVVMRLLNDHDTTIQMFAAHVCHNQFPTEAEVAGVYKLLPFLKRSSTNALAETKKMEVK